MNSAAIENGSPNRAAKSNQNSTPTGDHTLISYMNSMPKNDTWATGQSP